ncbi:MAG: hypothetical protein J0L92_16760 [Deltaproteobacteria bacterium]|nr:hypothetical protein [Deltaproteobacteria bacterium]
MLRLTVPAMLSSLALSTVLLGGCPSPSEPFPTDYETRWREARTPCVLSHDHELRYVRVFADDAAFLPYTTGTGTFTPGATLLKAEYDDPACTELLSYVLMVKLEPGTTPPEEHDWTWQRFDPDRTEIHDPRFIPQTCLDCHDYHCAAPPYGHDYTCTPGAPEPMPRP